ncbi:MAG TPA: hypothetical protein VEO54_32230 [Thermoanaerobaculia bacterium]|nr:hypothetical protein [Thermoanaerobaculia bacterium]
MIPFVRLMLLFARFVLMFVRLVLVPAPPHRHVARLERSFARLMLGVIHFELRFAARKQNLPEPLPKTPPGDQLKSSNRVTPSVKPSNDRSDLSNGSSNSPNGSSNSPNGSSNSPNVSSNSPNICGESDKRKLRATKTPRPLNQKLDATAHVPGREQHFPGGCASPPRS